MIRLMSTGQRAPTPVPAVVQVQPQLVNLPAVPVPPANVAIPPPKYHTQVSVASIDQEQFKTEDAITVQQYFDKVFIFNSTGEDIHNAIAGKTTGHPARAAKDSVSGLQVNAFPKQQNELHLKSTNQESGNVGSLELACLTDGVHLFNWCLID